MKKVLITGATGFSEKDIFTMSSLGLDCYFLQNENDAISLPYDSFDAVVCNNLFSFHNIELFSNLKLLQLTSSGVDRVPVDYIESKGIKLYNARGVYSIPIAEFVISGILELLKKKRFFMLNQSKRLWLKNRELMELSGMNCLIIGCGSVGKECAKRLSAFDCKVEGIDNNNSNSIFYDAIYNTKRMCERIEKADVVILTVPLTSETHHLINKEVLTHFKKSAILVNVSRGKIVCEEDLIQYIDNIGGAVLDVFEEEPLKETSPLWNKDNVIVSPHNSFVSTKNKERLLELVINNLKNL